MIVFRFLAILPFFVLYRIADLLYFLLAYVVRYRRRVIIENLQHSFPEKSEAAIRQLLYAYYRNIADIIVETIKLPGMLAEDLRRRVVYTNPEVVTEMLAAGQTVIGLASHQCNWEWLPPASCLYGMPVDSVYKTLNDPFSERLMLYIRSSFGAYPIPMQRLPRELVLRRGTPRADCTGG